MPHIKQSSQLASLGSMIPPELNVQGKQSPKSSKPEKPLPPEKAKNVMIPTLSILKYNVDPAKVYKQLFGKELDVNEHTGICNIVRNRK